MTETEGRVRLVEHVPQEGGKLSEVGVVTHFYSRIEVAAVRLTSKMPLRIGNILQFGKTKGRHFRVRNTSMELSHQPIRVATTPHHIGIEIIGHRAEVGSLVYIVTGA